MYLNRDDVKAQLGVPQSRKFSGEPMALAHACIPIYTCVQGSSSRTSLAFLSSGDGMKNFAPLIPPLLDGGIRVLNYAGTAGKCRRQRCSVRTDIGRLRLRLRGEIATRRSPELTVHQGNWAWMSTLNHSLARELASQPPSQWRLRDGKVAGWFVTAGNLTYVAVDEAGHMVPFDQPEAAREMIERYGAPVAQV